MFIVEKSFFSKILSKLNIKTKLEVTLMKNAFHKWSCIKPCPSRKSYAKPFTDPEAKTSLMRVTFSETPYHEDNYLLNPSYTDKKMQNNGYG